MKIVYFSPIAFSDLKQRPQYFAEGLSKSHQVSYIEPTKRILSYRENKEFGANRYQVNENLTVIRCDGTMVLPFRWNVYDTFYLNGIYEYLQLKKIINDSDVVIVGFEGWYNVIKRIRQKLIIYDKMDDNVQLSSAWEKKAYLQKCEEELLKKSRLMFVSAQEFVKRYEKQLPVFLIPNAFDAKDSEYLPYACSKSGKKVYGYVGSIESWFDNHVIEKIAEDENNQVVLVGPCGTEKIQKENVDYVGRVEKGRVAGYIRSFDVCLYPFKQSELLDTINPVKIYEYLSLNKPIIAVANKEIDKFGVNIYQYHNDIELEIYCGQELKPPFCSKMDYDQFMKENSWENRVQRINEVLKDIASELC